jgi:plasmid stabilization system protein ParE
MKVRYTLRAFAERERIFESLDARNPEAARRVVTLIKQRIEGLGEQPHKGRRTSRLGIYTLWITPYRYRVFIPHRSRR